MTKIIVTGAAGFIGYHVAERLLERGDEVVGIDNVNDYYDPRLKEARLDQLRRRAAFRFVKLDVADGPELMALFRAERFPRVIHLAAQAGVRYSLENPNAYVRSNLVGFANVLEACRHGAVEHLVYASSSSVYGANTSLPFRVQDTVDHPISLYAATKKANELMAHTYSHLYRLPTTGLRFFTVYGPWGRPDMALYLFAKAMVEDRPIDVFNNGQMLRDFTYVDDVSTAVVRLIDQPAACNPGWNAAAPDPATSNAPYRVYNIGNHSPVPLLDLIELLEQRLGRKARLVMRGMQPGDVPATYADVDALQAAVGFSPSTPIHVGVERFAAWFLEYHAGEQNLQTA